MEPDVLVGLSDVRLRTNPTGTSGSTFRLVIAMGFGTLWGVADSSAQREYPQRLHHEMPGWVKVGAVFHVRLRVTEEQATPLTEPKLAGELLAAARNYHDRLEWQCSLILLMPDHLHALLAFPCDRSMARSVGAWKRYATRSLGVKWQANFFDHRIRDQKEFGETWSYILSNPVVKGLCASEADWPWSWRP